jgi:hypothetical protein
MSLNLPVHVVFTYPAAQQLYLREYLRTKPGTVRKAYSLIYEVGRTILAYH